MGQLQLVITLHKDVDDIEQGETLLNIVRQKLTDHPEVEIQGRVTNRFPNAEPN